MIKIKRYPQTVAEVRKRIEQKYGKIKPVRSENPTCLIDFALAQHILALFDLIDTFNPLKASRHIGWICGRMEMPLHLFDNDDSKRLSKADSDGIKEAARQYFASEVE